MYLYKSNSKNEGEMISSTKLITAILGMIFANAAISGMQEIKVSNNQLGLQFMTLNMDYAEKDDAGVLLDTEKGPVSGTTVFLTSMRTRANVYVQGQYSRNDGKTNYVGGLIGPPSTPYGSIITTSAATIINYSFRLGKGFELVNNYMNNNAIMLTPYIELGRQEWYRGVNAGETYYHNAYGVGLLWQMSSAGSNLVISVNGLLGKTFGAYINVTGYFSGALGDSTLYKTGFNLDYALSKMLHLNGGVDYIQFSYGKSNVYSGYLEPDSTSSNLFYKAGIGISF
jgi:hypothetical protein